MLRVIIILMLVFPLSGCMTTIELAAEMYKDCVLREGATRCDTVKKYFSRS